MNAWVDKLNATMFSNAEIRVLKAKIDNPTGCRGVTLIMDSHDSRIMWSDQKSLLEWRNGNLRSYKLKKNGARTQAVIDTNGFALFHSNSVGCKNHTDTG